MFIGRGMILMATYVAIEHVIYRDKKSLPIIILHKINFKKSSVLKFLVTSYGGYLVIVAT